MVVELNNQNNFLMFSKTWKLISSELTLCYSEFGGTVAAVVVEFFAVKVPLEHRFVP